MSDFQQSLRSARAAMRDLVNATEALGRIEKAIDPLFDELFSQVPFPPQIGVGLNAKQYLDWRAMVICLFAISAKLEGSRALLPASLAEHVLSAVQDSQNSEGKATSELPADGCTCIVCELLSLYQRAEEMGVL